MAGIGDRRLVGVDAMGGAAAAAGPAVGMGDAVALAAVATIEVAAASATETVFARAKLTGRVYAARDLGRAMYVGVFYVG